MSGSWMEEFGFKENPYNINPLSDEEGDRLLVGREEEAAFLTQRVLSGSRIPVLIGNHGVGKTSIANVVAYRLSREYKSGNKRYFVLPLDKTQTTDLKNAETFEKNLCIEVLHMLLENENFLVERKIERTKIAEIKQLIQGTVYMGGGGTVFGNGGNIEPVPNPLAENNLIWVAHDWLKKCFTGDYSGGIICVIDNIEMNGTASEITRILERFRDTIFKIKGISWILCGTSTALNDAAKSSRLGGCLAIQKILPIDVCVTPDLILRRIEVYGDHGADPPVGQDEFEFLYQVVHFQLRIALMLSDDFAEYLSAFPTQRAVEKRSEVFQNWLSQKASELPEGQYTVPEKSWVLFDSITNFGSDIANTDFWIFGYGDEGELEAAAVPLKSKNLIESFDTDEGYILRVTKDGWLVRYQRDGYTIGRNNNGT